MAGHCGRNGTLTSENSRRGAERNKKYKQAKTFVLELAARARIAAGVLALLCALAYLGLAPGTVPLERRARAQIAHQLQIGEAASLREQSAPPK